MNAYAELGVEKDATQEEIKAAYKRASLEKHPDKGGSSEEFTQMKRAYDFIKDPKKRAFYDEYGDLEIERNVDTLIEKILNDLFHVRNPDILKAPLKHLKKIYQQFVDGEKHLENELKGLDSDLKVLEADHLQFENILKRLKTLKLEKARQLYAVTQEREICDTLLKEFSAIQKSLGRSLSDEEVIQTMRFYSGGTV